METLNVKFYWYQERGEIYAARNLDELFAYLHSILGDDAIHLTEENKGIDWDEVPPTFECYVNEEMTVTGEVKDLLDPLDSVPCQVATTYN